MHRIRSHLFGRPILRAPRLGRVITLGVQAVVVDPERRVLLVRDGYRAGWHFPGGGVERNETVKAALHRELFEETRALSLRQPRKVPLMRGIAKLAGAMAALDISQRHE